MGKSMACDLTIESMRMRLVHSFSGYLTEAELTKNGMTRVGIWGGLGDGDMFFISSIWVCRHHPIQSPDVTSSAK